MRLRRRLTSLLAILGFAVAGLQPVDASVCMASAGDAAPVQDHGPMSGHGDAPAGEKSAAPCPHAAMPGAGCAIAAISPVATPTIAPPDTDGAVWFSAETPAAAPIGPGLFRPPRA